MLLTLIARGCAISCYTSLRYIAGHSFDCSLAPVHSRQSIDAFLKLNTFLPCTNRPLDYALANACFTYRHAGSVRYPAERDAFGAHVAAGARAGAARP